jgi:phosphatidylinositol alpha 1,6-mannosyltransferase
MERIESPESMRIAFFSASMKYGQDGVTRVLYKVSEKLRERHVEHIFFTAVPPPREEQPVPMYKVPSVTVPFYKDYRLSVGADFTVASVLAKFRPDILCVNSPCSLGWAGVYNARFHRRPIVAYYHTHFVSYASYYKAEVLTNLGWQYMKSFYNSVDATFVPSRPILEELQQHGIRNLCLLPHGVDTDLFNPRRADAEWKRNLGLEKKAVLLYVGRLVWEKNLGVLAAAYNLLRQQTEQVALVIIGDGPIRGALEHLLPDALFLGYRAGPELAAAYASADLFVFPSTTETFGMVTLEAMASGLAPVCADCGGAADIIQDGVTGVLCKPGDAEHFAVQCLRLVQDPVLRKRMAGQAAEYAFGQNWDAIISRMLEEYRRVIEQARSRRPRKARNAPSTGQ